MRSRLSAGLFVVAISGRLAGAAPEALPLTDGGWELKGPSVRVERFEGRDVLSVENGFAYRRGVQLQDGTIDFDVQLTRRRSFVYLAFRMLDDREHEEIYLRPHKSGLPDAIQYAPVYQGESAWQLHHGPGSTAAVVFEPGAWTHVRLVLTGEKAAVFVGDLAKPALVVPRLARPPAAGYLALRGLAPRGSGEGPIARFANVSIQPGAAPFDFSSAEGAGARGLSFQPAPAVGLRQPGVVGAWAVSKAFLPGLQPGQAAPTETMPPALPAPEVLGEFRRVEAEPSGLVELHRYVSLPSPTSGEAAAVARVRLRVAEAGLRRFDLGFSDVATVFLNGRPLFRGDAHYSYDNPRQEGLIHYGQATVFLPLERGDNELAILVSDDFGGWGLMGRFPEASGLETSAR
jgi:hypothetical protein